MARGRMEGSHRVLSLFARAVAAWAVEDTAEIRVFYSNFPDRSRHHREETSQKTNYLHIDELFLVQQRGNKAANIGRLWRDRAFFKVIRAKDEPMVAN